MPLYDYQCELCRETKEVFRHMSEFTSEIECSVCGGVARAQISGGFAAMMRGMGEYKFNLEKANRGHSGMKFGRTAAQQQAGYDKRIGAMQKRIKEKKSMTEDGWEIVGTMPTEMHDAIARQEGDKNAVMMDPIPFLKATGTYTGRDDKK